MLTYWPCNGEYSIIEFFLNINDPSFYKHIAVNPEDLYLFKPYNSDIVLLIKNKPDSEAVFSCKKGKLRKSQRTSR